MSSYHPFYKHKSISSIKSLAKALDVPEDALMEMLEKADKHYFQNKAVIKPNGKKRISNFS